MPGLCPSPGKCENSAGSFRCICPIGYRLNVNKRQCEDIDECFELNNICEDGTCTNTNGAFYCTCPEGWINSRDGMNCIDQRREYCYDDIDRFALSNHIL